MHYNCNRRSAFSGIFFIVDHVVRPAPFDVTGRLLAQNIQTGNEVGPQILGIVEQESSFRPGLLSMSHGYGAGPGRDDELRAIGSSTSRFSELNDNRERYSGQPRMSGIPVNIREVRSWEQPEHGSPDMKAVGAR
jgi:hypothetical protein